MCVPFEIKWGLHNLLKTFYLQLIPADFCIDWWKVKLGAISLWEISVVDKAFVKSTDSIKPHCNVTTKWRIVSNVTLKFEVYMKNEPETTKYDKVSRSVVCGIVLSNTLPDYLWFK